MKSASTYGIVLAILGCIGFIYEAYANDITDCASVIAHIPHPLGWRSAYFPRGILSAHSTSQP
jgi:hypothetical protein